MPQSMQGMIIASLIIFLIGVIIGFYLRQGQINELTASLKESQARNDALQREHEERLRTATTQLQQDYENQLAEKIERYQNQYEEQLQQLEAEYQARQGLMAPTTPLDGLTQPYPDASTVSGTMAIPSSETEQRLRKQYEARLKEAAYKIQQAYEQHLREKLAEAQATYQQDYDQRLAEAIQRYQDEAEARLAEAANDRALAVAALGMSPDLEGASSTPGVAEANTALQAEQLAHLEAELRIEYDQRLAERIEQYQDEMTQRIIQMEEEFDARLQMAQASSPLPERSADISQSDLETQLRTEIESSLRVEYEQQLAEKIEQYQEELNQRTRELEQGLEAQLQLAQSSSTVVDQEPDFGLDNLDASLDVLLSNADSTPENPDDIFTNLDDLSNLS
jgi:hypothetical protein